MDRRIVKQLLFGGLFLAIVSGLVFYFYYLNNRPTCFDGIQNGKEAGVDCGGTCVKACLVILPIEVSFTKVLKVAEGDFDAVARIYNPNPDLGASSIGYDLVLLGEGGVELAKQRYNNLYILPKQTKHIVSTSIKSNTDIVGAKIDIKNITWEKLNNSFDVGTINFRVANSWFTGKEFTALVANESDFDFDTVDINVIVYGIKGDTTTAKEGVIAVNRTTINTLSSKQGREFKVTWPNLIDAVPTNWSVEANTNLFNNSNFIKRYGTPEEFQFKDQI